MSDSGDIKPKRFRIAFSFAGEKRDFVSKVAAILAKRFREEAILYDKYHEAEFARDDLGIYLPELYNKQSDLVVVVICPAYNEKEWTGLEWKAIFDLLKQRRDDEIMLCRFDHATVIGLHSIAGFVELNHKTPEQAAILILERLALNEGHPKDYYIKPTGTDTKPHSTTIPNNLPRLQPFFGRSEELKRIKEALDPENRTWGALIDGPGGMGKTSLAVRAAYDCPHGQFQRIIFLSVKDREMDDEGERKLTGFILTGLLEIFNELARQLAQPDITKAPEDQRVHLLLETLRPANTLLVLDNLESLTKEDRDQLFNFVKRLPQGCKAILTSRRRIGSGSELLILEKLDQPAALATLADLAQHNKLLAKTSEAERIALYTQTGGNPLLLRWVAGQLGRGSCRTFTDALHFLRSCPPGNDPLEFIFGDLVDQFTDDETKALAALTYFTLPAKVRHIADVAALRIESVEPALRALVNRSLVVPDQEEITFALVPLVAEFLRHKRPEIVAETGNRLEKRAYALILENGFRKYDRFPVLDAAWPTIVPALPLFLAGPNDRLQLVCSALTKFFDFTGRWDEWNSLCQGAENRAIAAGDYNSAGWRAYSIGCIHTFRQQANGILACAERAGAHWQTAEAGTRERAVALQLLGAGHSLKKDYGSMVKAYKEALDIQRSLSSNSEDLAIALCDVADGERLSGNTDAAERALREAIRVANAVGFESGVAAYKGKLVDLALGKQDWLQAEQLVRETLPLAEKLGIQPLIADDCNRLALTLLAQGKLDEALIYARRAVEIFTRLGSPSLTSAQAVLHDCGG